LVNDQHLTKASKDRTNLFSNRPEFVITSGVGKRLMQWCNSGADLEGIKKQIKSCGTLEQLRALYTKNIEHKELLKDSFLKQQEELKNQQIININKFSQNGATSS
jgi:hypothetical protein